MSHAAHTPPRSVQSSTGPVLQAHSLTHSFGRTPVLSDVSIRVNPGEIVAIMGPSGSGKSTLLHLLGGILVPNQGSVMLLGQSLGELSEHGRAAWRLRHLGFVFQFGDLIPELTVAENVELPLRLLGRRPPEARAAALDMLEQLGVAEVAGRRLHEVSGGQAQRAAVARALVHRPPVVLADEPTGSLDTLNGELVLETLVQAASRQQTAVVLVTHELRVASYAARAVMLRDGRIIADPNADKVPA